jgi:superfamily II DNA/RNA helicase
MSFESLHLHEALSRALVAASYTEPTSVQAAAIPVALAGKDLMVSSRTGSGKTASFMLPALTLVLKAREEQRQQQQAARAANPDAPRETREHREGRESRQQRFDNPRFAKPTGPRVLVLCPTRELAMQVAKAAMDYGRYIPHLNVATVVGGVPYAAQLRALRGPLDIVIATPGRLIDHLGAGKAVLSNIQMLVLDEADRMLDMGFIDDIHHIASATPTERQTVMFSATFGGATGGLARELLREPQRIDVASHTDTHADIEQRLHWADDFMHKNALLDHILTGREVDQALVFTSTQRDAEVLADRLAEMGHAVEALHGGMPQGRRNRVLQSLRNKRVRVLVATDVAARGIDVPTISHVINFGLPMKEEDYVHRIGRTGRAGRTGLAVTLAERRDFGMIQRIQRFTTQRIPAATINGLEPKRAEPKPAPRPGAGGFKTGFAPGQKPAGKNFGGGRAFAPKGPGAKPFKPAGKTFAKKPGPFSAR